jgi:hypothetical protein
MRAGAVMQLMNGLHNRVVEIAANVKPLSGQGRPTIENKKLDNYQVFSESGGTGNEYLTARIASGVNRMTLIFNLAQTLRKGCTVQRSRHCRTIVLWRCKRVEYDFSGLCKLYGAMFNLAYRDARQGCEEAINFLDYVVPEWRDVARRRQRVSENQSQLVEDRESGIRVTTRRTRNAPKHERRQSRRVGSVHR